MTDRSVELRSDTFTRPGPEMRRAMAEAAVGDDVWGEDPSVNRLEAMAAERTGKEAAIFVTSGTQGNLAALLSHTQRGQEVIAGDLAHIFNYETAGAAIVGGLQMRTLPTGPDGTMEPEAIRKAIRSSDIHEPPTGCVALESTHNRCGGAVLPLSYLVEVGAIAKEHGLAFHLDGARVFNAAVALGVSVEEVSRPLDSITFCLSKGLGAPVGSVLCGSAAFIERARRWRKVLGGGMRQAGYLAAAGIYAIEHNVERLVVDHDLARLLAQGLAQIPGVSVDLASVQSNMVNFTIPGTGLTDEEFCARVLARGVRIAGDGTRIRAVTSLEVTRGDIEYALEAIESICRQPVPAAV